MNDPTAHKASQTPFLVHCRQLDLKAPFRWLAKGCADMRHAQKQRLLYSLIMALTYILLGAAAMLHDGWLIPLAIMGGIVFYSPVTLF